MQKHIRSLQGCRWTAQPGGVPDEARSASCPCNTIKSIWRNIDFDQSRPAPKAQDKRKALQTITKVFWLMVADLQAGPSIPHNYHVLGISNAAQCNVSEACAEECFH